MQVIRETIHHELPHGRLRYRGVLCAETAAPVYRIADAIGT